jgi:aminocarboxymuconate-semialdehyde decarboxylase
MVRGKHFCAISEACRSPARRRADLPKMGLAPQFVSPMPELRSYGLELADAQPLSRFLNEHTAAMCAESGGALFGLAAVPLQDVDAALAELRAAKALGLVGVELGSRMKGMPLAAPRFDAFREDCCELDLPVFVHALKLAAMERLVARRRWSRCWTTRPMWAWRRA